MWGLQRLREEGGVNTSLTSSSINDRHTHSWPLTSSGVTCRSAAWEMMMMMSCIMFLISLFLRHDPEKNSFTTRRAGYHGNRSILHRVGGLQRSDRRSVSTASLLDNTGPSQVVNTTVIYSNVITKQKLDIKIKLSPKSNQGFFSECIQVKPLCKSIITMKGTFKIYRSFIFRQANFQWSALCARTSIKISIFKTLRRLAWKWNYGKS